MVLPISIRLNLAIHFTQFLTQVQFIPPLQPTSIIRVEQITFSARQGLHGYMAA